MSLALFTIFSDILSRLISSAEHEDKISGIKISRHSPKITHLMYVDDSVIYYKVIVSKATKVTNCLKTYCLWLGQEINWGKFVIHFSNNVSSQLRGNIVKTMNIQEYQHKGKYLGHPFCQMKSKSDVYKEVMERLEAKLLVWRQKKFSIAGRLTLVKSVSDVIPTFTMQVILLPNTC